MQNSTRVPKINAGTYILQIFSSTNQDTKEIKPKWKILRWGIQKVPDRKKSIDFDLGPPVVYDPFSTEYA